MIANLIILVNFVEIQYVMIVEEKEGVTQKIRLKVNTLEYAINVRKDIF